jgi:hypothetical protein
VGLAKKARVRLPAMPDVGRLRRRLVANPDRVDAIMAKDLSSKVWAYVERAASDDVAKSIDEALALKAERSRKRKEREERRRKEIEDLSRAKPVEERPKAKAPYNRKVGPRPSPARIEPEAPAEPEWTPYFHSTDPDAKKKWMAKSKGQMTEDLVGAIESNRGMLPPDLQATIPNLVRFVRMRGGTRVAGLMDNVYKTRKDDISRLMWLFFGARHQEADDFVNAVLGQMEDTWNREDFPSDEPEAAKPAEPEALQPAPGPTEEAAPVTEPAPQIKAPAQRPGLAPTLLMPGPVPTTIIEQGTGAPPAVTPTVEPNDPAAPPAPVPAPSWAKHRKLSPVTSK